MPGVKGRSGGGNAKTMREHWLAGTFRKDRHAGVRNPAPPGGRPKPPKKLTGDARAEWRRMIARLESSQVLSSVDGAALYQYCRLFAETEALAEMQASTGRLIEMLERAITDIQDDADLADAMRQVVALKSLEARYVNQLRQGRMAQRIFLLEFGLTPASRGRVKVPDASAGSEDPFREFDDDERH